MSRKRKKKMNEQTITNAPEATPVREIIGVNPDGSPIYREDFAQDAAHTGEVNPTQ